MVSFQPSEEEQMVRDTVAAFAREQIRPVTREADETGSIPDSVIQQSWELGLVAGAIPEALGGGGDARSAVTGALIAEELGWGDLAIALHILAPRLLVYPVLEMGTEEQKKEFLPRFTGPRFRAVTAAVMEPRFGFDPAEMTTTARRENGHYVLNGAKCYVPLARTADAILVYARLGNGGCENVAGFLVPQGTPGLHIAEREKHMGLKGIETYEIVLEECRIPASQRLGGDRGCNFGRILNQCRVALAALAVGVGRAAFEYARDYAKQRRAFGVPIAQKQAIAFLLAEMAIEIDASRLLAWEAAWKLDRGEEATREAVLAKQYAANTALRVTDGAVQILGGHGYIRDHPVEMWLRNARGFAVFEGLAIV